MAYRVLFHLNDAGSLSVQRVLENIRHLLDDLAPEAAQVELVAHGDGIEALQRCGNPQADTVRRLAADGVRFVACRNTMNSRGLTAGDLLEVARVVPAGIGEIVRREGEGWLYVHP
jgi:uncharacterized protein